MAQKVRVVCDLHDGDEVEDARPVSFGLEGSSYEVDLCEQHAAALRDDLASYVGAARRAGGTTARRSASRSARSNGAGDSGKTSEIRQWARQHGHTVNERGRIPSAVLAAYEAAH